jgi:hypothetical protein
MNIKDLKKGDRVRVIASVDSLMHFEIPRRYAEKFTGQTLIVVTAPGDEPGPFNIALSPTGNYTDMWYFRPGQIEPCESSPTIFATERMITAQELLHQLDSIHRQVKNLVGSVEPARHMEASLGRVIVEEIKLQTKGKS